MVDTSTHKMNPISTSAQETDLKKWVSKFIPVEDRYQIYYSGNKFHEIDIFCAEKQFGIELHGLYWHSEVAGGKEQFFHYTKRQFFKERGIRLIQFFENEWLKKTELLKNFVKVELGVVSNIMDARECEIREILPEEGKAFFNKFHLNECIPADIYLGIYMGSLLLSVVSLQKKDNDVIIIQSSSRINMKVENIIPKITEYCMQMYSPNKLLWHVDMRLENEDDFILHNYTNIGKTDPNFFYTKSFHKFIDKEEIAKKTLKKFLKNYDPNLSEWENMKMNGYDRIWDCGCAILEYNSGRM